MCTHTPHIFFIHSLVSGTLRLQVALAIIKSAAVDTGGQISIQDSVFISFRYITKSGLLGHIGALFVVFLRLFSFCPWLWRRGSLPGSARLGWTDFCQIRAFLSAAAASAQSCFLLSDLSRLKCAQWPGIDSVPLFRGGAHPPPRGHGHC